MNLVDLVKGQLSGDVIGKMASLIGESPEHTQKAASAAVPSMLSGLMGLASQAGGADKILGAIKGLGDVSAAPSLANMLTGSSGGSLLSTGGSILSSLMGGGNTLSMLTSALSAFSGIGGGGATKLLGLLAPVILGMIGKQLGKAPTAQGLTSLLNEQKDYVNKALPAGFSLPSFLTSPQTGGHSHASTTGSTRTTTTTRAPEPAGFPWWPLLLLPLLGGLLYFLFGNKPEVKPEVKTKPVTTTTTTKPVEVKGAPEVKLPDVKAAMPEAVTKAIDDLKGYFGTATETLGTVKDAATADAALPKLNDILAKLEAAKTGMKAIPDANFGTLKDFLTGETKKLEEASAPVMKLPGVAEKLGGIFKKIIDTLVALATR